MYCPECKTNTNHADYLNGVFCCVRCGLEHYYVPPGGKDFKVAATGEREEQPIYMATPR